MKILITGGLGYIGSNTAIQLLEANYDVVIVDNLSNSSLETLSRIENLCKKKISFYDYDLRDIQAIRNIFNKENIGAVIHFAGLKAVFESIIKPISYYENNVLASINLLNVMAEYDCRKIVFSSSATVYGKPKTSPIKENFKLSAINPYGETKLIVENFLTNIKNSNNKFQYVILRYFNPVGGHSSKQFGEIPNGIPTNIMPLICQVASKKIEQLEIYGGDYNTHDGTGIRDYIHVVDLAKGHINAINFLFNDEKSIVLNLGTGQGYSVLELINTFEKVNKVIVPHKIVNRRPGDVDICYADASLAKLIINWEAKLNLKDMCKDGWNSQVYIDNNKSILGSQ